MTTLKKKTFKLNILLPSLMSTCVFLVYVFSLTVKLLPRLISRKRRRARVTSIEWFENDGYFIGGRNVLYSNPNRGGGILMCWPFLIFWPVLTLLQSVASCVDLFLFSLDSVSQNPAATSSVLFVKSWLPNHISMEAKWPKLLFSFILILHYLSSRIIRGINSVLSAVCWRLKPFLKWEDIHLLLLYC